MRWFALLAVAGCAGDGTNTNASTGCTAGTPVACVCPDGTTRGSAMCTTDGSISACMGCAAAGGAAGSAGSATPPMGVAGAAGMIGGAGTPSMPPIAGIGSAGMSGAAGAAAMPTAGTGGMPTAGTGGVGGSGAMAGMTAPPPAGCPPGEMCLMAPLGGVKFCSTDPLAALPPTCTTANQACGTNNRGLCIDAATVGFAGLLFCIYTAC